MLAPRSFAGCIPSRQPTHLDARELCLRIGAYAVVQAGSRENALTALKNLGIRGSEDIGKIIFGLVGVGIMKARPDDRPEDFVGLFTLEQLFASGGPQATV